MLSSILALGVVQAPVITVQEPKAASPWVQIVRANCGPNVLTISGYGVARPKEKKPEIRVNERPVRGTAVRQLLEDLSTRSGAYRLQILCSASGGITVRINEGDKQENGSVRYRSGRAY